MTNRFERVVGMLIGAAIILRVHVVPIITVIQPLVHCVSIWRVGRIDWLVTRHLVTINPSFLLNWPVLARKRWVSRLIEVVHLLVGFVIVLVVRAKLQSSRLFWSSSFRNCRGRGSICFFRGLQEIIGRIGVLFWFGLDFLQIEPTKIFFLYLEFLLIQIVLDWGGGRGHDGILLFNLLVISLALTLELWFVLLRGCVGLSVFVVRVLVVEVLHDILFEFDEFLLDGLLRGGPYAFLDLVVVLLGFFVWNLIFAFLGLILL